MEREEYDRYNRIAAEKKKQASKELPKKRVTIWQLIFVPTKEKIIHGAYSLCQSMKNNYKKDNRYKIVPF